MSNFCVSTQSKMTKEERTHWLNYDPDIKQKVQDTKESLQKWETEIEKLKSRGRLQLNYNPPGMGNNKNQQVSKEIKAFETLQANEKSSALEFTDQKSKTHPPDVAKNIKQAVKEELSEPSKEIIQKKEAPAKEVSDGSFSSRFNNNLGYKQKMKENVDKPKVVEKSKFLQKDAGDKER